MEEAKAIEDSIPQLEATRDQLLGKLGNIVDAEVPVSQDEDSDNMVKHLFPHPEGLQLPQPCGTIQYTLPDTKPLTHDDLLWRIGGFDPDRGSNVAGHRGYFLMEAGWLLNQAIINYAVAFLRNREYDDGKKYQCVQPPYFMKKELMSGIAQVCPNEGWSGAGLAAEEAVAVRRWRWRRCSGGGGVREIG